jgi:hypothetical protein
MGGLVAESEAFLYFRNRKINRMLPVMTQSPYYTSFIFSDEPRHRVSRHLMFWITWVTFFTITYGSRPGGVKNNIEMYYVKSYFSAFVEALVYLPDHMLLSYGLIYFILPRYLFRAKYLQALGALVVVIVFVLCTAHYLANYAAAAFRIWYGLPAPSTSFYFSTLAGLRGGLTIGGFAVAAKIMKHWIHKNQLTQRLEREKLTTELQLLKAQVHPHFLFNTLNNLYSLTLFKSDNAPEVVLKLSALLRYMLYECNVPAVPLDKEIRMMQDYIELEKLRYGDRLDLSVNISGDLHGTLIAPLLLLPFLENSFKHGASEQLDQAWIGFDLSVRGNTMKMKLVNGISAEISPFSPENGLHGGIGLQNVQKRLSLLYPNQHELKIIQEDETFIVSLTVQLEKAETAPSVPAGHVVPYEL